ncbi:hypothetical protein HDA40_004329 [Hamadaea flava]|uniref:Uncharacterized protein n=1 Tax=Hamadaea flava TaxID=1742688 RepID=A0ABV8LV12_9ACTN|nr:hypothetical protein [Hamadaea flava]MCP2325822.1 hypothetical protein [Hamadaea flava]
MRLTVGPLPAAVYWRRRAVVLGGVLIVALLVSYACTSGPKTSASGNPSSTRSPSAAATGNNVPANEVSPTASPSASAAPTQTALASDEPVDPRACTDAELKVTAKPVQTSVNRGASVLIYLYIKNVSNRTCTRDIGPDLQELRVVQGAEKIWSSDDCDPPRGTNVHTFQQGLEVSFNVEWNGKLSTSCSTTAKRTPTGPAPDPGKYQVVGRVGTKLSDGVTLTIK